MLFNKETITISVSKKAVLKDAKQVKKILECLSKNKIVISRKEIGDIHLNTDAGEYSFVEKNERLTITAQLDELLYAAVYAVLREFSGNLSNGKTTIIYKQKQRILMVDMARKYFSKEILLKFIDSMSLAQFNYLQLHFSENEGFRIECETAPEIVSEDHLTKEEIREIILYANASGIEIIPDFDTPGHLQQILQKKPEWQLKEKLLDGTIEKDPSALNICDPKAVDFILSLYREYAELFKTSTYFHIGADEFVNFDKIDNYPELTEYAKKKFGEEAKAIDTFIDYVNQIIKEVNALGFVPRIWNDGFFRLNRNEVVNLSQDVEITYWTKWNQNMAPVSTFLEKGYTVINFNDNYFYYVLGENAGYTYPTYDNIADNWTPDMYPQEQVIKSHEGQLPGVAIAIWSDKPASQTQETVWKNTSIVLFALIQKLTGEVFIKEQEIKQLLDIYFR